METVPSAEKGGGLEGGDGDEVSAGAGCGRGRAVRWANGGVKVAEGANGVGDDAEEGVMADGGQMEEWAGELMIGERDEGVRE